MDKENVAYKYSGILFMVNKVENLSYATTWMKLEDIMLNETNQQQKDKYSMIMLIWVAQMVKNPQLPTMQETQVQFLGREDLLEKGMSTHSSILAWRRECPPTPAFLPGEFHGQRSLAGYSPWGHRVRHN